MGKNPSKFLGRKKPVEKVSWYDAVAFANALSKKDGLVPAYTISGTTVSWNKTANGWRLPTEAEWEYAAKGGNKSNGYMYAGSNDIDEVAWYYHNSGDTTHDVGTKKTNELGLFDLSGNVWEWCWDWYGDYFKESELQNEYGEALNPAEKKNPSGVTSGSLRVNRGGGWSDY
jgi:formylglycine-generating enzyme required for sulfatase activity